MPIKTITINMRMILISYYPTQEDGSVMDEMVPKSKVRKIEMEMKIEFENTESKSNPQYNSNGEVVQNKDVNESKKANLFNGLYNILILALCVLFSSPVLLLPQHNSIIHPDYWYEIMIVGCLSFGLTQTFDTMMACKLYFKVDSMISFRVFIYLYLVGAISWMFAYSMTYLVWTVLCGYNHPLPLSLAVVYIWFLVQYIALYVLFTRELSIRDEFRKKIRAFNVSRVYMIFNSSQFEFVTLLFNILPSEIQWILALLLPLLREINIHILSKILLKWPRVYDEKGNGKVLILIGSHSMHLLYVAIKMSHTTTRITSCLILIIDFILNLYSCKDIIRLHKVVGQDNEENLVNRATIQQHLVRLILVETLEALVPLAYVITILIAYYGPNANILGNIGNSQWQYEAIPDITRLIENLTLMFVIDIFGAIIVGLLLWKMCSIDVMRKASEVIKDYWAIIAVIVANFFNYVSVQYLNRILITA